MHYNYYSFNSIPIETCSKTVFRCCHLNFGLTKFTMCIRSEKLEIGKH